MTFILKGPLIIKMEILKKNLYEGHRLNSEVPFRNHRCTYATFMLFHLMLERWEEIHTCTKVRCDSAGSECCCFQVQLEQMFQCRIALKRNTCRSLPTTLRLSRMQQLLKEGFFFPFGLYLKVYNCWRMALVCIEQQSPLDIQYILGFKGFFLFKTKSYEF